MIQTLSSYLRLMRIHNCLIGCVSVIGVSFFAAQSFALKFPVILGAMAVLFIMGGGNTLNDYFDYKIDKLNRPGRPIPSGLITRRRALVFAAALFCVGLGLSLFLNLLAVSMALINSCLLIIYACHSKRMAFTGNILVALLTSSVFIFSGVILGIMNLNIVVLAATAFLVMTAREILKDIEDIQGDSQSGASTLPIKLGIKRARAISTFLILPSILLIYLPYIHETMNIFYLALVILATLFLIVSFFLQPDKSQKILKLATIIVITAFIVGSF
ncbi:UbiA family prenyltransferase [Acidobacteriota bacterium]